MFIQWWEIAFIKAVKAAVPVKQEVNFSQSETWGYKLVITFKVSLVTRAKIVLTWIAKHLEKHNHVDAQVSLQQYFSLYILPHDAICG